jgi:hypothetical protein
LSNHAVLGIWTVDLQVYNSEKDYQDLTKMIPYVKGLPGFVEGRWNLTNEPGRGYSYVVFEELEQAQAFLAQSRKDAKRVSADGIHLHELQLLDVTITSDDV